MLPQHEKRFYISRVVDCAGGSYAFTPLEAFAIDGKIDDGVRHQGDVRAAGYSEFSLPWFSSHCNARSGEPGYPNSYAINNDAVVCNLIIRTLSQIGLD